ncbi:MULTISPECIES: peptide chain release factor N(5)-glutamine methyltransferase [Staphylococcus]|uniref:peptide chain release factor N(5)-glutamine methyltransferase n=1 Tax=Staphylococcus TaxID=1279 RepID=UPI00076B8DC1|nr:MULTISPECIES: peptide chain release factor N(5)-glutamine methyltransferase [Staphylococcus]AMG63616.1 peptide chain release factor N(5)-glutamine methyltransferase [Staphylococcus lugdunensis]MCI2815944.1 peptide chain release factor N(5)-glutamine methyltransferase [Staphylococcus lugdunensis]MDU0966671.1 peptide chain release factor N(5)-glutamine methyltransferase [Staphylococcus lugdunensis]MDU2321976.1 peptide chain release factor N(5)-glutamine methyltransferase [Staphylococcus lugdun
MVNFKDKLTETIQSTSQKGFEQSRAEWLMLDLFHWTRTDYLMHMYDEMTIAQETKFNLAVQRMLLGEPIQYIVGFQSFYGYSFKVNENCLIPRPETEEVMLHFLNGCHSQGSIVDVGTGSGAIAITIKKLNPQLKVIATDLYKETLTIAQENASYLDADIIFMQGDVLKPLIQKNIKVDGLISNPPYISEKETCQMTNTVLKYEPHHALFAENNGFAIYEAILDDLPKVLNEDAFVTFEIGYQQGLQLKQLVLQRYPKLDVKVTKDINGLDRIVSFKWI